MKQLWLLVTLLALLVPLGLPAAGSPAPVDDGLPWLSKNAKVSLITQWPGNAVYLSFGHSALRVRDETQDFDRLYNYGVVSVAGINDPLFLARFVYGQLDYMMDVFEFGPDLGWDKSTQNRIWNEQVLNLNQTEANQLLRYLANNARPENAVYRYDFILDNCSTRITMAMDKVFGEKIQFDPDPAEVRGKSFHRMIDEFVAKRPLFDWAFYIVLGMAADRQVTAREAMFLPFYLSTAFDKARIIHDGRSEPLVVSAARVYDPAQPTDHDTPNQNPAYILWPLAALIVGWTLWGWWRRWRAPDRDLAKPSRLPARWGDFLLVFAIGLAGLIVWFLTIISSHAAVKYNLNALWLWPWHLVAAFFVLAGVRWRWLAWYFLAAAGLAALPLVLWPFWPQDMHPTMIPLMLIIACRSLQIALQTGGWPIKPSKHRVRSA